MQLVESLSKREATMLIQLRTDHIPLNYYLHRIGKLEKPNYPGCGFARETIFHLLVKCEAHAKHRERIKRDLRGKATDMGYLLSNSKAVLLTLEFMAAANRSRQLDK